MNDPNPRDPWLTRRRFFQVGGVGMFGLNLPDLLWASDAGQRSDTRRTTEKSCIFVLLSGGPSQVDMWDLKPNAPVESRGPYKPIATPVSGMQLSEKLPRLAALGNRFCLIRSLTHKHGDHGLALHPFLSGQSAPPANAPYFGSILAKLRPAPKQIPSYVWLQDLEGDFPVPNRHQMTGGILGPAAAPCYVSTGGSRPTEAAPQVKGLDPAPGITLDRLSERFQLLQSLDGKAGLSSPMQGMQRFQERALDLVTGPQTRRAFDLNLEPAKVRARYGMHPLGRNLLAARRLIEAGVRVVTVMAGYVEMPPGEKGGIPNQQWDMHGFTPIFADNGWASLGWVLPRFDQALSGLLDDLQERGLLDSTLVVAVGEMGREPRTGKDGKGRGHWPDCYTGLLAGGGIRGGAIYGASDRIGAYVKDQPVTLEDLAATFFHGMGVPPETRLGADGFTRPVSEGRPILEIFG